jgi:hypothetical protein
VTAFIITRIQTGDYDSWRPMFDQDRPRAREKAQLQRVLRSADDPDEVFIYLEYASLEESDEARDRARRRRLGTRQASAAKSTTSAARRA